MANYNKKISDTNIRIGEVRFGYCHVFSPRKKKDGSDDKYGVQLLIPKSDKEAVKLINDAIETAKTNGVSAKWNGKMPPASKLTLPLRDGDEENPDDPTYEGMWFMNANTGLTRKPGIRVLDNGQLVEALDEDDFYSGCYGAAAISLYPYNNEGKMGVACALNNVVKTRDGEKLAGGRSAEQDFDDLTSGSCLD